ncbi:uncharacterized protein LOC120012589 [Tripterygium wilfordii]|uniref:uncharacterized protein LOC120012589 n=1 Tax=Tripterygium wilfordii TaxID=458696 RepID=UPI0018F8484C|nr:uncharacterized protein LOC120012589 [Tripterygium wilfordii]
MVKPRASRRKSSSVSCSDDVRAQNIREVVEVDVDNDSEGGKESDSDDSVMNIRFDNSDEDDMDDDLFLQYTDGGIESDPSGQPSNEDLYLGPNNDAAFSDAEYESDSLRSYDGSTEEEDEGVPREVNPLFKSISIQRYLYIFKDAVATYAIQGGWQLKWLKFDNVRARVACVDGCKFLLFCSKLRGVDTWELKTVVGEHVCERTNENKMLNSKWLANRLVDKMRRNPKMKLVEIIQKVRDKYTIEISKTVASRARKKALEVVHGSYSEQYKRLHDFCAEILRSNPGSTCGLIVDRPPEYAMELESPTPSRNILPKFDRLYMCLDGCKQAFLVACRPIVGLDGCFLKGMYGGQLLAAIERDPNDGMLPIAIAVVRVENTETWDWFIKMLLEDIGSKGRLTFISDRQKGLVHVLEALEGQHDHRFCVRHMYNNISKRFPGLKELMWKAARATYREAWKREMQEIERLNPMAHAELNAIDPRLWCKSHFSGYAKCDTLLNNMSETFNSTILQFREKPIAMMLDEIKGYFMTRWAENRIKINRYQGTILPKIKRRLEIEHKESGKWLPKWAGDLKFEVLCMQEKFVVDLDVLYCSCRK